MEGVVLGLGSSCNFASQARPRDYSCTTLRSCSPHGRRLTVGSSRCIGPSVEEVAVEEVAVNEVVEEAVATPLVGLYCLELELPTTSRRARLTE